MTAPRQNPDWYRVKYSLAAESFNAAYVAERGDIASPGERRSSVADGGEAETARAERIAAAEGETRELLGAIEAWLHRDRGWGLRRRRRNGRGLDDFLSSHLRPSAFVLLAGIELFKRGREESRAQADLEEWCLDDLEARVGDGLDVNPYALASRVAARWDPLPASISFNLACFYTQAWRDDEDGADLFAAAQRYLRRCVEVTAPSERDRLRDEIGSDPILERLARWADGTLFQSESEETAPGRHKL